MSKILKKLLCIFSFLFSLVFVIKAEGWKNIDKQPKVSVIIPVYATSPDSDLFLIECLNSVVNQTLKEIEIICVDDKSPKQVNGKDLDLGNIFDVYANIDQRIKVIHRIENGGVSAARNDGLRVATGEYVTFCDDDDFIHPQTYEYAYRYAKKDDVDFLNFGAIFFKDFREINMNSVDFHDTYLVSLDNYTTDTWCVWNCLFKSDLINSTGIKFISRKIWEEDFCFLLEFLPHAKRIKKIDSALYYHRNHANNLSGNIDLNWTILSRIEMIRYITNLYKDKFNIKGKSNLLSLIVHSPVFSGPAYYNCSNEIIKALGDIYNKNIIFQCPRDVQQELKKLEDAAKKQNKKVA